MIALVIMVRLTIIGAGDQQQHPHPASSTARDSGAQPNASVRALVMTETLSLINASGSCETRMSGGQEIDLAGILRVRASHRVCLSPNAATRHPPRVRVPHRGIQLENLDRVRSIARTSNPWGPRDFKVAWTKALKQPNTTRIQLRAWSSALRICYEPKRRKSLDRARHLKY